MEETLAYNSGQNGTPGWVSRYSYLPDMMIGMNSTFYSFKNGELYKHDSLNVPRNNFYETQYDSTVTTLLNTDPMVVKMFKTISLDSDHRWSIDLKTDLNTGFIDALNFSEKEGNYYGYIRKEDSVVLDNEDIKQISTQGIGKLLSISVNTLTFNFNLDNIISVGDRIYKMGSTMEFVGNVVSKTATTITLDGIAVAINTDDFIIYGKNKLAESYGVRGYYMEATLTNTDTTAVEIFAISSSVFNSFQ